MKIIVLLVSLLFLSCATAQGAEKRMKVIVLGDSLTAGYKIGPEQAFPRLMEKQLQAEGMAVEIVNAGVSGSTSASGPSRMKWLLRSKPDIVLICLGANDGLRGQPVENMKKNLRQTIELAQKGGAKVLLVGMRMPPNYGSDYTQAFKQAYPDIAQELDVVLLPFLLSGVAGIKAFNLPDGIHPNAAGHRIMSQTVLVQLRKLL